MTCAVVTGASALVYTLADFGAAAFSDDADGTLECRQQASLAGLLASFNETGCSLITRAGSDGLFNVTASTICCM